MFKRAIFVVLEAILFLAAYCAGVVLQMTSKLPSWYTVHNGGKSLFYWDGIVLLAVVFLIVVLVQVLRKTITRNWGIPTLALVLALLLLAATKFPFSSLTPS